jgi:hypothetical protein
MSMTPGVRKLALFAHVSSSLGWLGAVISFLVLSIAGLNSRDVEIVRAVYVAMNLIGEYALVPLSLAALVTGIVQALGTPWGLFRHLWVVVKLVLTVGGTLLLMMHQFTLVRAAAERVLSSAPGTLPDGAPWGTELVTKSAAAVLLLLVITGIAIYKPWGMIPSDRPMPKALVVVAAVVAIAFAAWHLAGGMHHGH